MKLRRKILNSVKGKPQQQKAVAMALYLKYKFGRCSMCQNYTINKLHKITKISPTTLKKYIPILKDMGLISFAGKDNRHLVVNKLSSDADKRNIRVDKFCFKTFRDTYYSLRAFLALIIQSHKEFIKRAIQIATDPKRGQNFKAARQLVKRLVRQGFLRSIYDEYKEYGISYKRIARETGNCVRTAQNTIKYAIKKKWATKQRHYKQVFAPNVCFRNVQNYTFSTRDNLYIIYANTYTIKRSILNAVSTSDWYGKLLVSKK